MGGFRHSIDAWHRAETSWERCSACAGTNTLVDNAAGHSVWRGLQGLGVGIVLLLAGAGALAQEAATATGSVVSQALSTAPPLPEPQPLWPATAPGSEGLELQLRIVERSADAAIPDRYAVAIKQPALYVYRPPHPDGRALLVIPGGGYQRVALDKEGTALAPFFSEQSGITLFVLQYRLPAEGHRNSRDIPLADAQRAMRLIRHRASEWGIDPARLGVMGFSAGGHVAASLATRHAEQVYAPVDALDQLDPRPDYAVLMYPVIDMGTHAHPGSRQRLLGAAPDAASVQHYSPQHRVNAHTPPVFLLHAQDDPAVPVENSLMLEAALRRAGIEHELHLYAHGGHGFGVRNTPGTLALWPQLVVAWIRAQTPLPAPTSATEAEE